MVTSFRFRLRVRPIRTVIDEKRVSRNENYYFRFSRSIPVGSVQRILFVTLMGGGGKNTIPCKVRLNVFLRVKMINTIIGVLSSRIVACFYRAAKKDDSHESRVPENRKNRMNITVSHTLSQGSPTSRSRSTG